MINNLNSVSFSEYGAVLAERQQKQFSPFRHGYDETVKELDTKHKSVFKLEGGKLYLDFLDGMTVLAVSLLPEPGSMEFFYLDKPVIINDGVFFALFSLFDRSSVRCRTEGGCLWLPVGESLPDRPLAISRKLTVPNIYTLFYQEKEKAFFFKGEHHSMLELTYVDKGSMHSVVNGVDHLLSQGEMMLYGPEQWHMQYSDADSAVSFFTISFDLQCPFLELLLGRRFALNSAQAKMLQRLMRENEQADDFSNDIMIVLLEQLLLEVLRMENPAEAKLRSSVSLYNENSIVGTVQAYIAENIYRKLTVGLVAAENNISVSHLSALFRRHMNISLGEYIRRAKLEEGKSLIWEGRNSFSQIATLLHYSSANHFSKQFKDHFGLTPSQYARSVHP